MANVDYTKFKYEIDQLQQQLLQRYLQDDMNFRRAYYTDYTTFFAQYLQDKIKLKEPITLSIIGQTRCLKKGSKILCSNGELKKIEEIKIGEEIISPQKDGTNIFAKVTNKEEGKSKCYDIIHNVTKKLLYTVSENHKIPFNFRQKFGRILLKNGKRAKGKVRWIIKEYTPTEYLKLKKTYKRNNCVSTISTSEIETFRNQKNSSIDPYTLGIYIGDGSSSQWKDKRWDSIHTNLRIDTPDTEVIKEIEKKYPYQNSWKKKHINCFTYSWSLKSEFFKEIKRLGFIGKKSGTKFIPKECLYSDSKYRKKLLAGLIDSDGHFAKKLYYQYTTKSEQLVKDIQFLVHSLGGMTRTKKRISKIKSCNFEGEYYEITIIINFAIPTKIKRKTRTNYKFIRKSSNRIRIKIKEAGIQEIIGITIDSPSNYIVTDNFMVTHNSGKSTSAIYIAGKVKEMVGETLLPYNVCGSEFEFIDNLKNAKKNDFYVIDESKKTVFGVGSTAKKLKILDVQNIIAVNNISTIWIRPDRWSFEHATYGLRSAGRSFDSKPRYNKYMLYNLQATGGAGEFPMGMVYIPHYEETLKDGKNIDKWYRAKKQAWVDKEQKGEGDAIYKFKLKIARKLAKDDKFSEMKKKQKIVYISATLGSEWTRTECDEVVIMAEMIRGGMLK